MTERSGELKSLSASNLQASFKSLSVDAKAKWLFSVTSLIFDKQTSNDDILQLIRGVDDDNDDFDCDKPEKTVKNSNINLSI